MIRKVLVTGDKGYIGSVLTPYLIQQGFEVVGLDTDYYSECVFPGANAPASYRSVRKDIRNVERTDIDGIDGIIHLCALSNDPMGDMSETLTEEINYQSTVRLAELACESGVQSFIFSSSCSIYGKGKKDIVSESDPTNPLTAYAKSKVNSETELSRMSSDSFFVGLMRNSTVYGFSPKFRDDLVVNNLVVSALKNGELRVMSDGTPWRPLIDVRDLSTFFIRFLTQPVDAINGKVVNVGFTENNFQVKDVVAVIHEVLPTCDVRFTGEHGADTRSYRVSFDTLHSAYPDSVQQWTMKKSVMDLVDRLSKQDPHVLADGRFTRIAVLKKLIAEQVLSPELFWIAKK